MFVSTHRFEQLEKRVNELEHAAKCHATLFLPTLSGAAYDHRRVPVSDVLRSLLNRLGWHLEWDPGRSPSVRVVDGSKN